MPILYRTGRQFVAKSVSLTVNSIIGMRASEITFTLSEVLELADKLATGSSAERLEVQIFLDACQHAMRHIKD